MTNPIAQDLGGVVRLLEKATPGKWNHYESKYDGDVYMVQAAPPKMHVLCRYNGDGDGYTQQDVDNAAAIAACVNFLRTHSAEIAGALRDAERYRWLRMMAKEELLNPKAAGSEWPDIRTYWRIPTLICSGPVGGFIDFDAAIDSAMQQGGGGGE